jgi:hypothetical protein
LRQWQDGNSAFRKVFRPNECQAEVFATLFSLKDFLP